MKAGIELTICYGFYGESRKSVAVPVDESLMRELVGRVELSNEPFSLMLASPAMFGGKGDAATIRRRKFEMRRETAELIAQAMVPALLEAFGVHDELDGYRVSGMGPEEQDWHRRRGRLPPAGAGGKP